MASKEFEDKRREVTEAFLAGGRAATKQKNEQAKPKK